MTENRLRCVITGLGLISAVGNNTEECWKNILAGKSGIDHTTSTDTKDCYVDYAAECKDPVHYEMKDGKEHDRAISLCLIAEKEALTDAGLKEFGDDPRVSVIIGSCVGGVKSMEKYSAGSKDQDTILDMPISAIANACALECGAGGVVTNVANACAAGTMSIAYASDLIRDGKADVVIAGGTDAFGSVPYAGFLSLSALDKDGCSPFNRSHGITLGEGAGIVIVESYEHAMARGAKVYCEVLGSGISSDAHHITAPRPDGEGQMNAIRFAMEHSGVAPSEIGYVNAHGTGTAKNDDAEFLSLHTLFDDSNADLSVSSTKAATGHCLGAAGAMEAVLAVKALVEKEVPPTIGYTEEDLVTLKEKAGAIDFVPNKPRKKDLKCVMNNSFAFGGNNASIIFSSGSGEIRPVTEKREVVVTGLGPVTPLGNGREKLLEAANSQEVMEAGARAQVSSADYERVGLKMAFYRKLDHFSQLQSVSGKLALQDAGYQITDENAVRTGIIIGSATGALGSAFEFEEMVFEKGNAAGSAFKFPNTVYNAAGGYLSICCGVKGYNVTVTNGAQSGLQSVAYAAGVLKKGWEDAMIATGSDENSDTITGLYDGLGISGNENAPLFADGEKFLLSDGSVSTLLETREAAEKRGARIYATIAGCGMSHVSVPFGTVAGMEPAVMRAVSGALAEAGITASALDCVFGFANGRKEYDELERSMMQGLDKEGRIPVISVKERYGEARSAAAQIALEEACLMLSGEITNEMKAYRFAGQEIQRTAVSPASVKNVLLVSVGIGGSCSAVVLKK